MQDGPNRGQSGWIQSKTDHVLVDSREQWEVEKHVRVSKVQEASPISAGRIVKMKDAKKSDALAAFEIPEEASEPIEEIDRDEDKRQLSCGYCVCTMLPAERTVGVVATSDPRYTTVSTTVYIIYRCAT